MRILVFDNYDSFTYNLVHLVEYITGESVDVFRNDQLPLEKVKAYDKIILSPGPGIPEEAGLLLPLIKEYAATKSILGVCLGHQAIGQAMGGTLVNLDEVYHGVAMPCQLSTVICQLFKDMPCTFDVGRYHSWVVRKEDLPDVLEITAEDEHGFIMAMQHKTYDLQGVQFHPESVLTPLGEKMMRNWLHPPTR
ncbi:MAG: aminodeoxychorismate/anthranilate synthase component II [Chitinophagaceae bacterium]|jgi:anthranilate synthase component 2|nr:aminodeoxychorismate/anthranilate synthase component II [Chitinophagaceae bacterium]